MGSSAGEEFNPSAGELVWVRLNNGSWWPGRVMGLDELSEISPVPRRIGTPVMLLGRKNINIDWYNIPKSKRVKAFRCEEYNHCIEKAKASSTIPKKKNVKHPRRDDAILLALELENAQMGKEQPNVYAGSSSPGGTNATSPDQASESDENSQSALELSQSGISFEEPNQINPPLVKVFQGGNRHNCSGSEDDGLGEGSRRMKGLEDLGMCLAANKMTGSVIVDCSTITIPTDMVKSCSSFLKRKRTQVARVQELLKRKKRCRQLTQVMESANMVYIPVLCNQLPCSSCPPHPGVSSCNLPSSLTVVSNRISTSVRKTNAEGNEIRHQFGFSVNIFGDVSTAVNGHQKDQGNGTSSPRDFRKKESLDGLFDVPLAREENHTIDSQRVAKSGFSMAQNGIVKGSRKSITTNSPSLQHHWNLGGALCVNSLAQRMKKGTSKWQSKRKRNSRRTNKGKSRSSRNNRSKIVTNKIDLDFQTENSDGLNLWFGSSLYSVELQSQATYRPEHVPFISLSSRLNGKAIVGHPVTIEVLCDMYCGLPNRAIAPKRSNSKRSQYFLVKSRKRKSPGLVSKKMRRLSSFNTQKKGEVDEKLMIVGGGKGSVMACIPVKMVFSRLNEAVNGPAVPSCQFSLGTAILHENPFGKVHGGDVVVEGASWQDEG